jgi:hypothetical protein
MRRPVPLDEDSELRRDRYPYRGKGYAGVPDDYEKPTWRSDGCDVELLCFAFPWSMGPMTTNYARVRS